MSVVLKKASDFFTEMPKKSNDNTGRYGRALRKRILLVDDNSAHLSVLATLVEVFGYRFDIARNGWEAVQKAKTGLYPIILMDMHMPDMDGVKATRFIRKHELLSNQKPASIICLTASTLPEDHEYCLAVGMNDCLTKPYKPRELRRKLSEVIKKLDRRQIFI